MAGVLDGLGVRITWPQPHLRNRRRKTGVKKSVNASEIAACGQERSHENVFSQTIAEEPEPRRASMTSRGRGRRPQLAPEVGRTPRRRSRRTPPLLSPSPRRRPRRGTCGARRPDPPRSAGCRGRTASSADPVVLLARRTRPARSSPRERRRCARPAPVIWARVRRAAATESGLAL